MKYSLLFISPIQFPCLLLLFSDHHFFQCCGSQSIPCSETALLNRGLFKKFPHQIFPWMGVMSMAWVCSFYWVDCLGIFYGDSCVLVWTTSSDNMIKQFYLHYAYLNLMITCFSCYYPDTPVMCATSLSVSLNFLSPACEVYFKLLIGGCISSIELSKMSLGDSSDL